jgi:hypothetical protein
MAHLLEEDEEKPARYLAGGAVARSPAYFDCDPSPFTFLGRKSLRVAHHRGL